MSGESLRAMIVRARWIVTVVVIWRAGRRRLAHRHGLDHPSSYASRESRR
jgi:hypothetical protein